MGSVGERPLAEHSNWPKIAALGEGLHRPHCHRSPFSPRCSRTICRTEKPLHTLAQRLSSRSCLTRKRNVLLFLCQRQLGAVAVRLGPPALGLLKGRLKALGFLRSSTEPDHGTNALVLRRQGLVRLPEGSPGRRRTQRLDAGFQILRRGWELRRASSPQGKPLRPAGAVPPKKRDQDEKQPPL